MSAPPLLHRGTDAESWALALGRCVTDGGHLFRVVSGFDPRAERPAAMLEDCMTLAVRRYPPELLAAMACGPSRPRAIVDRRAPIRRELRATAARAGRG